MPAGLDTIMSNYELLKKAWEGKKLQEVEKLLLTLKIEFAVTQPANERVRSFKPNIFLETIFRKWTSWKIYKIQHLIGHA